MKVLLIIYLIINIATFMAFGIDKYKAVKDRWRIPEKTLLLMGLCFGGTGQLLGMKVFHHKTHKWYFRLTAWLFAIVQTGLVLWIYTKIIG